MIFHIAMLNNQRVIGDTNPQKNMDGDDEPLGTKVHLFCECCHSELWLGVSVVGRSVFLGNPRNEFMGKNGIS